VNHGGNEHEVSSAVNVHILLRKSLFEFETVSTISVY
jgi:hypothetical protein